MKYFVILLSLSMFSITHAMEKMKSAKSEIEMTYEDIQKTFGTIPVFIKMYPEMGLPAAWEEYKTIQMDSRTVLSDKLKQLIGVGIAAQIPSKECSYMSTQFAKLNGASEMEIQEAVAMAAASRHWSTFLNGVQMDEAEFRRDTDNVVAFVKKEMNRPEKKSDMAKTKTIAVVDAPSAYEDIKQTLGSVPHFFRMFPEVAIPSAWKAMKTIQLNPNTSLTTKEKELIGLAVSAQIPCQFCTYFHTEVAILNGASAQEVREAIAVASITRQWSTVLHGGPINEKRFQQEIDQIIKHVKARNSKNVGVR